MEAVCRRCGDHMEMHFCARPSGPCVWLSQRSGINWQAAIGADRARVLTQSRVPGDLQECGSSRGGRSGFGAPDVQIWSPPLQVPLQGKCIRVVPRVTTWRMAHREMAAPSRRGQEPGLLRGPGLPCFDSR
jgi:hypothetical protein